MVDTELKGTLLSTDLRIYMDKQVSWSKKGNERIEWLSE